MGDRKLDLVFKAVSHMWFKIPRGEFSMNISHGDRRIYLIETDDYL